MPSLMLDAVTAEISKPAFRELEAVSRMHSEINAQLAAVSKTRDPGYCGRVGKVHSRLAHAIWFPLRSNARTRALPVPASTTMTHGSDTVGLQLAFDPLHQQPWRPMKRLDRTAGQMRRERKIVELSQWRIAFQRLMQEDIDSRARKPAFAQRRG